MYGTKALGSHRILSKLMKVAIQVDRQDGSLEPLKEEQQNGPLKVKDGNLLESWGSHVDVPYH